MTWWHKVALGTVPVVGLFLCAVLAQVFVKDPQVFTDLHTVATEATTTVKGFQPLAGKAGLVLDSANTLVTSANTRVVSLGVTQTKLNNSLDLVTHRITDLCSAPQGCGLIPDASRTLNTARGTMGQVEIAVHSFDQHQSVFYTQETELADSSKKTFADLDELIADPDLALAVHNFNSASLDIAGMARNGNAITTDGKVWLHEKLFPTKKKGFVSGFEATGDVAKHWMPSLF